MSSCNVCSAEFDQPIYISGKARSLTTMNTLIEGETQVYFCDGCGHAQTSALPDLERFYAEEYDVYLYEEDDDQLYMVDNGERVYRSDHQARVLSRKIDLSRFRRVLDYGCAKAPTLRKLCADVPGIEPHMFDVTDKYIPFWEAFPEPRHYAAFKPDPTWQDQIDVVLSFYALEHIPDLKGMLDAVTGLLVDGGYFYFLVPNMYANAADFIVADHVNHFSANSLHRMLRDNGFFEIEIDEESHDAAFVVSARIDKSGTRKDETRPDDIATTRKKAEELSSFWGDIKSRINRFEAGLPDDLPRAIYGAGIYGNFIYSCLDQPAKIDNFIDQNEFLAGKEIHGVNVVPPSGYLPAKAAIFAGLNPRSARGIIASVDDFANKTLDVFYLD